MRVGSAIVFGWALWGCTGKAPTREDSASPADTETTPQGEDPEETLEEAAAFLRALAGLWNGSATQTPLGAFPWMPVDLRPVDEHTVWGRVDLDPDNALRFAFEIEDHSGPKLVYRNGGYFLGMLRDDRTALVEADPAAGIWRFCHLEQGCAYLEATYTLQDADLLLEVTVRGSPHLRWDARRVEERTVPDAFPSTAPLPGTTPLPALPEAEITVTWQAPLAEDAHLWVLLSTTPCLSLQCVPSRASRAVVPAGATAGTVRMPEIHAGDYLATAVLDYDRDLLGAGALVPETSDGYSLPDRPFVVATEGLSSGELRITLP